MGREEKRLKAYREGRLKALMEDIRKNDAYYFYSMRSRS
jgi:hypothetical protein